MTRRAAASLAGIAPETLAAWLSKKPRFAYAVQQAEAECQDKLIDQLQQLIETGKGGDLAAIRFMLERRFHVDWRERQEVSGAEGGPVEVIIRYVDDWRERPAVTVIEAEPAALTDGADR
jgi:hypothetical protein